MSLKSLIMEDLKKAMKERDDLAKRVTRSIKAEIKNREVEKIQKELNDGEIVQLITKMVKTRKDSASEYKRGNREDLAIIELEEADFMLKYLPKQLTEEELLEIVKEQKNKLNISEKKDMGRLIKAVRSETDGRAEGKMIANLVKNILS